MVEPTLFCVIAALGLTTPGLVGWNPATRAVLRGAQRYRPSPLPPLTELGLTRRDARRASFASRLALHAARQALPEPRGLASVFACASGDTGALEGLLTSLAARQPLSPTQFSNSLYSTPLGYWAIANSARAPSTCLSAYDGSFAAGLLDAACYLVSEREPVLLVVHDVPPPAPLYLKRAVTQAFALALLLQPSAKEGKVERGYELRLTLAPPRLSDPLADSALERLRLDNPAARGLALLGALARQQPATVYLPYLPQHSLRLECRPC